MIKYTDCNKTEPITKQYILHHINNKIPIVINYNDIDKLPERNDFINNINDSKELLFMPITYKEFNNIYFDYYLYLFGIQLNGKKTCIKLKNIPIFVDIKMPDDKFESFIRDKLISLNIKIKMIKVIERYPYSNFSQIPTKYVRIYTNQLPDRNKIIEYAISNNYETAFDYTNMASIYNIINGMLKFNSAGWNIITSYNKITNDKYLTDKTENYEIDCNNIKPYTGDDKDGMKKQRVLCKSWDIETYSTDENGVIPSTENENWNIFMINSSYFWVYSDKPILTVCIVDVLTEKNKDIDIIILCKNQKELLIANYILWGKMNVDISLAFNGSNFDWKLYLHLIKKENLLNTLFDNLSCFKKITNGNYVENVEKYFNSKKVKLESNETYDLAVVPNIPGRLDTDAMIVMKKIHKREEVGLGGSLNHFLKINGLDSKEDMEYKRMFKIYKNALALKNTSSHCSCSDKSCDVCKNAIEMSEVAKYCTIDCLRPFQLYLKRSIIFDAFEMATFAFISLYDTFYKADGMKVRNFILAYADELQYSLSLKEAQRTQNDICKEHFPGAYVVPPIRGLDNKRPISALDFQSLYPSLIMTYNLSPSHVVKNEEEAENLIKQGYDIITVEFDYEVGSSKGKAENKHFKKRAFIVRHNNVENNKTHTYNKVVNYIFGDEKVICNSEKEELEFKKRSDYNSFKRIVEYKKIQGRNALPNEKIGLLGFAVKLLFDKRVNLKKQLNELNETIENMKHQKSHLIDNFDLNRYEALIYERTCLDAKQKAIKVINNTFYGESGNYLSPLYKLDVCGSITTLGQQNLKEVIKFVQSKEYKIIYGDTDSVYMHCPSYLYTKYDNEFKIIEDKYEEQLKNPSEIPRNSEYYVEKLKYWENMVRVTQKHMDVIKEEVSDMLMHKNGTIFLNMAYEEVGFPCVFTGKKKYFMIPHEKTINFFPDKYFIRGIDTIKQGKMKIFIGLGNSIISEILSIYNHKSLLEIIHENIIKYYNLKIDYDDVFQLKKYKPLSKNPCVTRFVERMREICKNTNDPILLEDYNPPTPGDKFASVIINKNIKFDFHGCKEKLLIGDRMEYLHIAKKHQLPIDKTYYFKDHLAGLFARFIANFQQFYPTDGKLNENNADDYKELDAYCVKQAKNYIINYYQELDGTNNDEKITSSKLKTEYRSVNKVLKNDAIAKIGPDIYKIVNHRSNLLKDLLLKENKVEFNLDFIDNLNHDALFQYKSLYFNPHNMLKERISYFDRQIRVCLEEMNKNGMTNTIIEIIKNREFKFTKFIDELRENKELDIKFDINDFTNEQKDKLQLYYNLVNKHNELITAKTLYVNIAKKVLLKCNDGEPKITPKLLAKDDAKNTIIINHYECK